jgi:hypothetical protein
MFTAATARFGLILSSDGRRIGRDHEYFRRAVEQGKLVRLRPGAFCEVDRWNELDSRDRHILRMRAAAAFAQVEPVFCGRSAAAVLGMPMANHLSDVVEVASGEAAGGRSGHGIRRIAQVLDGLVAEEHAGLRITGVAATSVQLALTTPFAEALGSVDWARSRRNLLRVNLSDLQEELERRSPRYQRKVVQSVIGLSSDLSDSFGESLTRGVLHELGYPPPELQVRFSDDRGVIGVVDYFWRTEQVIGEFDGMVKYHLDEYLAGKTPSEVVVIEKLREDRLRREVRGMFRSVWADARNPVRLDALARTAGLRTTPRV